MKIVNEAGGPDMRSLREWLAGEVELRLARAWLAIGAALAVVLVIVALD